MTMVGYVYLGWVVAAGLIGFLTSAIIARLLHLPCRASLIPYVGIASLFLYAQ
jgi:hypothetical protein